MSERTRLYSKIKAIPGIRLWLDAALGTFQDSAFTTPAAANNDPIGGWRDQSDFGNDVIQTTNSFRPLLKTAQVNGLPAIQGNGTTQFLHSLNDALTAEFWIVATLTRPTWVSANTALFGNGRNATSKVAYSAQRTTAQDWLADSAVIYGAGFQSGQRPRSFGQTGGALVNNQFYTFSGVAGNWSDVRKNGVSIATTQLGGEVIEGWGQMNVLCDDPTASYWDGPVAELLVGTGPISQADLLRIEKYQGAKFGTF